MKEKLLYKTVSVRGKKVPLSFVVLVLFQIYLIMTWALIIVTIVLTHQENADMTAFAILTAMFVISLSISVGIIRKKKVAWYLQFALSIYAFITARSLGSLFPILVLFWNYPVFFKRSKD